MRREKKPSHRLANRVITTAFCVGLVAVSTVNALTPSKEFSENENRTLQQMPEFKMDEFLEGKYGEKIDKYISDQFLMRDTFISLKAVMEKALFKTENKGTYFGKDNYLIQIPAEVADPSTFNPQVEKNNIEAIRKLAELGTYQVDFLLAPTSFEIMQDKLPDHAYTDQQLQLMQRVKEGLDGSGVTVIDPTEELRAHKEEQQVYYRTDHHWTTYGAYLAYTQLGDALGFTPYEMDDFQVEKLSDEFYGTLWSKATLPSFPADTIEAYIPKEQMNYTVEFLGEGGSMEGLYAMDKLETKDKYSVFLDGNHSYVHIASSNQNGKKLFVIKDSYAHALVPFLANHYQDIYMLDMRYFNGDARQLIDQSGCTDVLFIYNCENFKTDNNLVKITVNLDK
ncbi:MAG: DHHW family protein [Eubacteriales bacterium]|jgi:hypothetical protein